MLQVILPGFITISKVMTPSVLSGISHEDLVAMEEVPVVIPEPPTRSARGRPVIPPLGPGEELPQE